MTIGKLVDDIFSQKGSKHFIHHQEYIKKSINKFVCAYALRYRPTENVVAQVFCFTKYSDRPTVRLKIEIFLTFSDKWFHWYLCESSYHICIQKHLDRWVTSNGNDLWHDPEKVIVPLAYVITCVVNYISLVNYYQPILVFSDLYTVIKAIVGLFGLNKWCR